MDSQLPDLAIDSEQLRTLVLDYLSSNKSGQLNDLYHAIANRAVERGFHAGPKADPIGSRYGGQAPASYRLSSRDFGRACEVVWDLIIEGIVRPGPLNSDQGLPCFHVTDYGRARIEEGPATPYDPDGYLKSLMANEASPQTDEM
jgi:hypothetical protein